MRICSCTKRVCSKNGPCDVQNAVDAANRNRLAKGKPPLANTAADQALAVGTFYQNHKAETGHAPCRGCQPLVRNEVAAILAGGHCEGSEVRL